MAPHRGPLPSPCPLLVGCLPSAPCPPAPGHCPQRAPGEPKGALVTLGDNVLGKEGSEVAVASFVGPGRVVGLYFRYDRLCARGGWGGAWPWLVRYRPVPKPKGLPWL